MSFRSSRIRRNILFFSILALFLTSTLAGAASFANALPLQPKSNPSSNTTTQATNQGRIQSSSPTAVTPTSTLSDPSPPTLTNFWNGNAYFERSYFSTPVDLQEPAPLPNPYGNDTGLVYTYYRTKNSGISDGIGVAISRDGGVTYSEYNNGLPVVPAGTGICDWDASNVVIPSVVRVGSTFFMVYEGASKITQIADPLCALSYLTFGDIGLATSTDGLTWAKYNGNGLFLIHDPVASFECNNIGGPSVNYFNGQFYIFFHGNCGPATDLTTLALCVAEGLPNLFCKFGVTPCVPGGANTNCPVGFRFDGLRNKAGMVHVAGTDLRQLQSTLQNSVFNASPIMDIGVGAYSWDSRVNGRPNVIYEDGNYYLFFEGAQYVACRTLFFSIPLVGDGVSEGNWGWGVARTADINNGPWEKYAYNPIRQLFQNQGTGCGMQQPYVFQLNGVTWVYFWSGLGHTGWSNVLVSGTDPYLHVYPAINTNNLGQCQQYNKIGYVDGDGWAQATKDSNGNQVPANRLCYGPYQNTTSAGDYSTSLWTTWTPGKGAIPAGNYAVTFRSLIDSTSCANDGLSCAQIITQDITHNSGSSQDSSATFSRNDYQANFAYQNFEEQFAATSGQSYEWRTQWQGNAYTRLFSVVLRQLNGNFDITPPTATINSLPANSAAGNIAVSWSGSDAETGIWYFDVQYQINGGSFTSWQTKTTSATATLTGAQCFNTYGFRVRARDLAGNLADYSSTVSTYIACDFSLAANPASVTGAAGQPETTTIATTPINGYSDTVNLFPDNTACSLNPLIAAVPGTSTLSCTFAQGGSYTVTVTGTGHGLTHTATIAFTALGIFLTASPTAIPADFTTNSTLTAQTSNNAPGINITFTAIVGILSRTSCITGSAGSCTTTIRSFSPGVATVTAASPSYENGQATVTLFSFQITSSPNQLTISKGASATITITVTSLNGFSGTVSLFVFIPGASIHGPFVSLNSTSVACSNGSPGTSTLTVSTINGTAKGTYTVFIIGTSGNLVNVGTITLNVV